VSGDCDETRLANPSHRNIRFIMSHMGGVTSFLLFRLSGLDDEPKLRPRFPDGVAAISSGFITNYDVEQSAAPLSFHALLEVADLSIRAQCRKGHERYDRGACAFRRLRCHTSAQDCVRQRAYFVFTFRPSRAVTVDRLAFAIPKDICLFFALHNFSSNSAATSSNAPGVISPPGC